MPSESPPDQAQAVPRPVRRPRIPAEIAVLVIVMAALGAFLVPCCYSTVWSEQSWTGWNAAMAGRVLSGTPLYTAGARVPIGPLAVAEMAWLGRPVSWVCETAVHFLTDCASVLLMCAGLRRLRFSRTVIAVSALSALPVRAALLKLLLYDELALFFAACSFFLAASLHRRWEEGRPVTAWRFAAMGACAALSILSKYSIGLGLLAGSVAFLAVAPWGRHRWRGLLVFAASFPAALALGCLLLSPWMSLSGFLVDVIATGSETKGGSALMLAMAACINQDLAYGLIVAGLAGMVAVGYFRGDRRPSPPVPSESEPVDWAVLGTALGMALLAFLLEYFGPELRQSGPGERLAASLVSGRRFMDVLVVAGTLTALLTLIVSLRTAILRRGGAGPREAGPVFAGWFTLLLAPTFVMFCLSGGRWILSEPNSFAWLFRILPTADPLDLMWLFGFAALCSGVAAAASDFTPFWRRCIMAGLAGAAGFASWSRLEDRVSMARACTERWPEVAFLDGARLRPASSGMREVIREVRALAPGKASRVLMLPEDPQTVALFERPRPDVQGGILFFDMYRDAFVDADFARVEAAPPEVIVIGPERGLGWGLFMFGPEHDNRGTSRFIRRVEAELLPRRYLLAKAIPVNGRDGPDRMLLYKLRP